MTSSGYKPQRGYESKPHRQRQSAPGPSTQGDRLLCPQTGTPSREHRKTVCLTVLLHRFQNRLDYFYVRTVRVFFPPQSSSRPPLVPRFIRRHVLMRRSSDYPAPSPMVLMDVCTEMNTLSAAASTAMERLKIRP